MPGFARGQFNVDYEERVDVSALRQKRVDKAQKAMAEEDIDALFLWKVENVRYLTSMRSSFLAHREGTRNAVILPREGRAHVMTNGGEIPRVSRDMPWIEKFHHLAKMEEQPLVDKMIRETLRPLFEELGLIGKRVGLDLMTFIQFSAYQKHLDDVEFVNGDSFMHKVRRHKIPEEIYMIREACAIADAVNEEAMDSVRAGKRECDVAADAMKVLHHYGGEMAHLVSPFVASGEHMSPPYRFASDKIIRSGDMVFIDIGAQWNGYFGDVARTMICGKPSKRQKEIYTAVHESLQLGLERTRPRLHEQTGGRTDLGNGREIRFKKKLVLTQHRPRVGHLAQRASLHRRTRPGLGRSRPGTRHGLRHRAAHMGARRTRRRRRAHRGDGAHHRRRP